uniref:Uncharacterized protein n=1 Tax=Arundo donax TaxID=35708 RepID=A0A0A9E5M0_ARUDO
MFVLFYEYLTAARCSALCCL